MPHAQENSLFLSECKQYVLNIRVVHLHNEYDIIARDGSFIMLGGHLLIDAVSKPSTHLLSISNFSGRLKTHLVFHIDKLGKIVFKKQIKSLYPVRKKKQNVSP